MDRATPETDETPAASPAIVRELGRWTRACWVIDPLRALLVAANTAGFERLGLAADTRDVPLDPAMPAIRALRQIASTIGPGEGRVETLEFALPSGPEALTCDVYRLPDAPGLLIIAPGHDAPQSPPTALADPERDPALLGREPAEPPRRVRDDAETLAEIARAIRAGQAARRNASPPPALPATSPLAKSTSHRASDEARLAHELRTPLSAIVAASEIMKDQRFGPLGNERYVGYAADIFDSARHALGVINAMLGMQRDATRDAAAATPTPHLQFAEIDVAAIAASAVSSLQPLAADAGITLSNAPAPRLPRVIADAVSVRQILLNLLTNALKFTPRGGRIDVATSYTADGPVAISVADTGIGMTAADIARASDASLAGSGDSEHPRAPGSLGIGLPLARALAAANGATLTIDSAKGRGTTVTFAFGRDRVILV